MRSYMPSTTGIALPVACPPAGFSFDPAPPATLQREGSYLPLPALTPIPVSITLEEAAGQHMHPRIIPVKCGLELRFNPAKVAT